MPITRSALALTFATGIGVGVGAATLARFAVPHAWANSQVVNGLRGVLGVPDPASAEPSRLRNAALALLTASSEELAARRY